MKNNKGLTLVSLIITVIILLLIAGIVVKSALDSFDDANITAYVSEMNIIQQKVNNIYYKIKNNTASDTDYGTSYENLSKNIKDKINFIVKDEADLENISEFRYLGYNDSTKSNDLEKIGVYNIKKEVIINFNTRKIYSLNGIRFDGDRYYNQYELPGGNYNFEVVSSDQNNLTDVNWTTSKENYDSYTVIKIYNVGNLEKFNNNTFYYRLVTESNDDNNYWQSVSNNTFKVYKSGDYIIKVVDNYGNEKIGSEINVTIVNEPNLIEGMIPIVYDELAKKWKIVDKNSGDWYDYEEKKLANVMLSDGIYGAKEGQTAIVGQLIEDDELGTRFVWVPRYAYKNSEDVPVELKFLRSTTQVSYDDTKLKTEGVSQEEIWEIPNAMDNVTGIWVEKNVSGEDVLDESAGIDLTRKHQMTNEEWVATSGLMRSRYVSNDDPISDLYKIKNMTLYVSGQPNYDQTRAVIK